MDQDFLHLIFLWVWEQGWKQTTDWRPWGGRSRNSAALATTILSWNCFCLFVQSLSWSLIRNDFFALALVVCVESGLKVDHWLEALRGRSGNSAAQASTILNCFFFCLFVSKGFWSLITSRFLALKVTGDVGKVGGVEQCWANKVLTQGETGLSMPQQI